MSEKKENEKFALFCCYISLVCNTCSSSMHLLSFGIGLCSFVLFLTILLGTRKMVRIGIIGLALSDPHFCILSRDCFNLSREYFLLWAIKTSLDRNASALLDPKVIFTRRSSFNLSSLLETTGRYFSKICAVHRLSRLVLHT